MTFGELKDGDRVYVTGDHSHAGRTGTVTGWEDLGALPGQKGCRVKLDDGFECFVLKAEHVKVLARKRTPIRRGGAR
jgi:hypothetical protein